MTDEARGPDPHPNYLVPQSIRWPYLLSALAGFVFLAGDVLGNGALGGAWPHALVIALSLVSFLRPTLLGWTALMGVCIAYLGFTVWTLVHSTLVNWLIVVLAGLIPTRALWEVRPKRWVHQRESAL